MDQHHLDYIDLAIINTMDDHRRYEVGKDFFPQTFDNATLRFVVEMFLGPMVNLQIWRGVRHGK